jgi:2-haloacid dehalogenase
LGVPGEEVLVVSVINYQASHFARFFAMAARGRTRSAPVAVPGPRDPQRGQPGPGQPGPGQPGPGQPGAVNAVLWDVGGVLLDWDPRYLYRQLFGDDVAAMEDFLANVCTPSWHAEQDLGRPIDEACAALAGEHPGQASLILAWGERNEEMVRGQIDASVELLSEVVRAGVRCYALTNMERESFERRVQLYEFFGLFDGHFVSGVEGVMKPDPRFFKLALERFGLVPEETLFTDDKAENVAAAAKLGVPASVFRHAPGFRQELVAKGVLD